ncbi:MAG: glutamine synthetase family protein, partial [Candidatus Binatia bacterium]
MTRGMMDLEQLSQLVRDGEIDTVLTVFPDMYGRLVGKRITGDFFISDVLKGGMHVCDYLLACDMEMDPVAGYEFASWQAGYGDIHAVPDTTTLRRAAWLDGCALVLCDLFDEACDEPIGIAPRQILKAQVEAAAAEGWCPCAGSELEFFILRDSYEEAHAKGFDDLQTFGWYVEDYHTLQGTKEEPLVREIRRVLGDSGIPVEFSKGEWGPGQHEINLRFTDMLEMADRHAIYKQAAKEVALMMDLSVTFMAKMSEELAGNSMHLHSSLWKEGDGGSLFLGDQPLPGSDLESSDLFRWYLGGLMSHARECTLWFAPNVNSYKRFVAGSFAPTGIAWSWDNRTAGYRIVGRQSSMRVECRIPGGDANPYLAMAATLASGLDGIRNKIEPPAAFDGDVYKAADLPSIPRTLDE